MKTKTLILTILSFVVLLNCENKKKEQPKKEISSNTENVFVWEGANIYFLLTDRFNNGDTSNDTLVGRTKTTGKLRGFEGGDIKGVTQKIEEGYFTDLGINAIWMTPIVEQIHGATDEGTGITYGYHGYWAKDWTAVDPNYGTKDDLKELVEVAHKNGIRVVLDAVINHTGPVTEIDPVWPNDWVRTEPQCQYSNYENTITCTLVKNLPDIKTESNENVKLPPQLVKKWKAEGRYEEEVTELDAFFERTGHPRAPRFYIMKWLTDYITDYGIDGYRCDTVKHTEEFVWSEFKTECDYAFAEYKKANPDKVLDGNDFYLVGEVYNYGISGGKFFDFGDKKVNYYDNKFTQQINFEFKWNAKQMLIGDVYEKYDKILHNELNDYGVLNYLSSHDDGSPFDPDRKLPKETGTLLLLSPGAAQVYYGDESARSLVIEGTVGDATLRSNMNWNEFESNQEILNHYYKLGQFRNNHPAVGAGKHEVISESPYVFSRTFTKDNYADKVIVVLKDVEEKPSVNVSSVFENGEKIIDYYSGQKMIVEDGEVMLESSHEVVLLQKI
jgi:alpha-amylase